MSANRLFEFTAKVERGAGCDMPQNLIGALVTVYAAASDHLTAVKNGVAALAKMNFVFEDLQGDVREIPVEYWGAYVSKAWPEFAERFPTDSDLPELVETEAVFFGPFAGYER